MAVAQEVAAAGQAESVSAWVNDVLQLRSAMTGVFARWTNSSQPTKLRMARSMAMRSETLPAVRAVEP